MFSHIIKNLPNICACVKTIEKFLYDLYIVRLL